MPEIVLASSSTSRRRILEEAGVTFRVVPPDVDESILKRRLKAGHTGPEMSRALAGAKAVAVSKQYPYAVVLGADQVLWHNGRSLDKPPDARAARRQLLALRGKTHALFTAVAVAEDGRVVWRKSERASLTIRSFSKRYLEAYLETEAEWLTSTVGGYRLEGRGAQLFSRVRGDFFGILGLPLLPLLEYLRSRGALPV